MLTVFAYMLMVVAFGLMVWGVVSFFDMEGGRGFVLLVIGVLLCAGGWHCLRVRNSGHSDHSYTRSSISAAKAREIEETRKSLVRQRAEVTNIKDDIRESIKRNECAPDCNPALDKARAQVEKLEVLEAQFTRAIQELDSTETSLRLEGQLARSEEVLSRSTLSATASSSEGQSVTELAKLRDMLCSLQEEGSRSGCGGAR